MITSLAGCEKRSIQSVDFEDVIRWRGTLRKGVPTTAQKFLKSMGDSRRVRALHALYDAARCK